MKFSELGLNPKLLAAVAASGYETATAVQEAAIPAAMQGADLMVASATGSGKTAAFVLPCLQRLADAMGEATMGKRLTSSGPRILVLAPTRELAMQVAKATGVYGKMMKSLKVATVVGGVPYGLQIKQLSGPLDVLIATPGRLLDLMQTRKANLGNVEILVLDEADRMLDMGFIEDIEAIALAVPAKRQTLMFSATFAGNVGNLAKRITQNARFIEVNTHTDKHDNITQRLHWADDAAHKNALLDHLLADVAIEQALVFTSTQRDADKLSRRLQEIGHQVAALHGGMPQGKRNSTLTNLRSGRLRVLVATDVAARGLDVPTISHVFNYGMPINPEDYVHRIGRTGRAGREGQAVTLAQADDQRMIRAIERFTTHRIPVESVVGLEPRKPMPNINAPARRPAGSAPSRGKPRTGGAPAKPGSAARPQRSFGGNHSGNGFGGNNRSGERSTGSSERNGRRDYR
jgi:superfamily II DNA/RNA helicase